MDRLLAFSPHLDDAVISAGARLGTLAAADVAVTVVTLFAGVPSAPFSAAAREMHRRWGLSDDRAMAVRRDEDIRATSCLGLRHVHEDFLDAIYRQRGDGSWLLGAGQPPWADRAVPEADLAASLTAAIRARIEANAPPLVLTCAAIGNHVDHVLTRDAVVRAVSGTDIGLELWEDLPYGLSARGIPHLPDSVAIGPRMVKAAPEAVWVRKYQAIDCYASQHSLLWRGRDFRRDLRRHETALAARRQEGRAEAFWRAGG
ncbi:MAG TPA: PIG-L family deacetylase [Streptosporangiaceae bacterium]|nr:PIG-L family deacetylase [Streptosporangiaceae bacterium]